MPLRETRTLAPVSAAMASQRLAMPRAARMRTTSLIPRARATLALMVNAARWERRRTQAILERSSATRATSAVSRATSEPAAPMAMPTVAAARPRRVGAVAGDDGLAGVAARAMTTGVWPVWLRAASVSRADSREAPWRSTQSGLPARRDAPSTVARTPLPTVEAKWVAVGK